MTLIKSQKFLELLSIAGPATWGDKTTGTRTSWSLKGKIIYKPKITDKIFFYKFYFSLKQFSIFQKQTPLKHVLSFGSKFLNLIQTEVSVRSPCSSCRDGQFRNYSRSIGSKKVIATPLMQICSSRRTYFIFISN